MMQLLPALNQGGVERGTLDVARALVESGHESIVVSAGGRLVDDLEGQGSEHHRLDIGRKSVLTVFKARALAKLITAHRPDIVHVRSRLPAWILKFALKQIPLGQRPRVVSTLHGMNSVSRYSKIMLEANQIIAVSNTCLEYWRNHYPDVDLSNAQVIYRGIDDGEFRPGDRTLRSEFGITDEQILVLFPGRITQWKGHRDLIQIAKQAPNNYVFWIVGEGKPGSRFESEIREAARDLPIQFLGHRADMAACYRAADVTLSLTTTTMESFGRAPVESLACGTPVIAYNHGAVGETLELAQPDGLVPVGDVHAVLRKLSDLPTRIEPCGYFSLSSMLERTITAYSGLLRPRVLNVMLSTEDGGLQRVSDSYAKAFEELGFLCKYVINRHGDVARRASSLPRVATIEARGRFADSGPLKRIIREQRPDMVFTHGRRAADLVRKSGFPRQRIIPLIHSAKVDFAKSLGDPILVSEAQADKFAGDTRTIIHNPIAPPERPPEGLLPSNPKRIGFVGRMHTIKRPEAFIRFILRMRSAGSPVEGHLFGNGPLYKALRNQYDQPFFVWHGWVGDRSKIYSNLDLTMVTSHSETFSLACAESLAYGVPAFSVPCGGPDTWLGEQLGGSVLSTVDPDPAEVIQRWRELSGLQRSLVSEAAIERFGPDVFRSRVKSLVKENLEKLAKD